MRILFIRHGEPDYENDCLTANGRAQAAAAAARLKREGITKIFSSPNGRAKETASYTADLLGLPVTVLEWLHEIDWGGPGVPADGHPWTLGDKMIEEDDFDFFREDWRKHPFFAKNKALACYDRVAKEADGLLTAHGFRHEGTRFFCEAEEEETIAVFYHGGSGACVLAHLLSLPFPYVCVVFPYGLTSISELAFPVKGKAYVHPHVQLFNDVAHVTVGDAAWMAEN